MRHVGSVEPGIREKHHPEGLRLKALRSSATNDLLKHTEEDTHTKPKKRLGRGYTHLEGEERVTAAFQKMFVFMEAGEQREEKLTRTADAK